MERKVIIRWRTKDAEAIEAIRKRFKLPHYTNVNGLTPGVLLPEDEPVFEECVRRGFFTFMDREWSFNGLSYSW